MMKIIVSANLGVLNEQGLIKEVGHFIVKPVDTSKFFDVLKRYLDKKDNQ
jgi:hypothetical protein